MKTDWTEAGKKAWRTRVSRMDEEEYKEYIHSQYTKECWSSKKEVRDLIMSLGGVNDPDYESLPTWTARRCGRKLDVLAAELERCCQSTTSADEVYQLILEVTP